MSDTGEDDTGIDDDLNGPNPEDLPKTKALYDWRGLINATLIIAGVILGALAIWKLSSILLLVLCAAMLAIVLDASARALTEPVNAPRWIGLAVSALLAAGLAVAAVVFAGPTLAEQLAGVVNQADEGLQEVGRYLGSFDGLPSDFPSEDGSAISLPDMLPAPGGILSSATAAISSVFGLFGSVLVVSVVGIYFAVAPQAYVEGCVRFAPRGQRRKMRRLLSRTGTVLQRWLIGKGISMLIVGVMSYAGLAILGVPLAFFLAVFAGLAAFVPFLGPVVGGLAMGLVALSESWQLALWVLGLYLIIQTVESYLLTPLVQERTVYLLPAVVLVAQLVMGTLFGILGVALATPLTAIAMTVLEETYFNKGPAGSG